MSKARWFTSLLAPAIGNRPISDIEPAEVLMVLKDIEKQGNHETAKRTRAFAARVFRYAIVTSRTKHNAAADLGMALVAPKTRYYAAIIDPVAVGGLRHGNFRLMRILRQIDRECCCWVRRRPLCGLGQAALRLAMKVRQPPNSVMSRAPARARGSATKPLTVVPSSSVTVPMASGAGTSAVKLPKASMPSS